MFAYGDGFTYAGIDSNDFNVILCSFDNADDMTGNFALKREIISEGFNGRLKNTHYGTKYSAPLEFNITIVKNPCKNNRDYFLYDEIQDINSWLTAYNYPQKLIIYSDYLHDVYFNALFTDIEYNKVGDNIVALTFTVVCDSPYAWEDFNRIFDCSSSTSETHQITFYNNSNEKLKLFYPNLEIISYSPTVQSVSITNKSTDDEDNKVVFQGLKASEIITMDGELLQFTSSDNTQKYKNDITNKLGYFNFEWLYLIPGKNILEVEGNCRLKIYGSYARKVGVK